MILRFVCLKLATPKGFSSLFPLNWLFWGYTKNQTEPYHEKIFYSYVPMIFPYCPIKSFHNIHVTWLLLQSDHFPIIPILFRHIMVPLKPYYGSIYNGCFSSHIFSHPAGLVQFQSIPGNEVMRWPWMHATWNDEF